MAHVRDMSSKTTVMTKNKMDVSLIYAYIFTIRNTLIDSNL